MNDCRRFSRILPLFAGGELGSGKRDEVSAHVTSCAHCTSEVEAYELIMGAARNAWDESHGLPAATITRIAHNAAGEVAKASWWRRPVFVAPSIGLAAGVSMAALLVVLALPMMRNSAAQPQAAGPVRLDMQVQDGVVHMAWSDGKDRPYKVYKASDPRLLGQGEAAVVRGNNWVDRHPDSAQIVFYRVE